MMGAGPQSPVLRAIVSAKPMQISKIRVSSRCPRHFNSGSGRGCAGSALELQDPTGQKLRTTWSDLMDELALGQMLDLREPLSLNYLIS